MKILVIHEVSYRDKPVYEYQDFAERLVSRGHDVTVIDFSEGGRAVLKVDTVSRTGVGFVRLISLRNSGVPILKYVTAKLEFPGILRNVINSQRIDCVLLYSVFINGTSAISICRELGITIVYRVLDAYHRLRSNPLEAWLLKQGEKYIYRHASVLSVTNSKMAEYVHKLAGRDRCAQVVVTDHGVDTEHFQRKSVDRNLAAALGVTDTDFLCVFLGTTYRFSRLDQLASMVVKLRKEIPFFKLLILGSGELDSAIKKAALDANVSEHVLQPGMVDYHDLPKYLALASIAINPFEINEITKDIIPIKILQYLASELPVVSTPLSDLVRKIPNQISGVFYSKNDQMDCFFQTMLNVVTQYDIRAIGKTARIYVKDHHSVDRVISDLERILIS